jgi:hypothetical protein
MQMQVMGNIALQITSFSWHAEDPELKKIIELTFGSVETIFSTTVETYNMSVLCHSATLSHTTSQGYRKSFILLDRNVKVHRSYQHYLLLRSESKGGVVDIKLDFQNFIAHLPDISVLQNLYPLVLSLQQQISLVANGGISLVRRVGLMITLNRCCVCHSSGGIQTSLNLTAMEVKMATNSFQEFPDMTGFVDDVTVSCGLVGESDVSTVLLRALQFERSGTAHTLVSGKSCSVTLSIQQLAKLATVFTKLYTQLCLSSSHYAYHDSPISDEREEKEESTHSMTEISPDAPIELDLSRWSTLVFWLLYY